MNAVDHHVHDQLAVGYTLQAADVFLAWDRWMARADLSCLDSNSICQGNEYSRQVCFRHIRCQQSPISESESCAYWGSALFMGFFENLPATLACHLLTDAQTNQAAAYLGSSTPAACDDLNPIDVLGKRVQGPLIEEHQIAILQKKRQQRAVGIVGPSSWIDLEKIKFSVLALVAGLEFAVGSSGPATAAGKNIGEMRIHVPT